MSLKANLSHHFFNIQQMYNTQYSIMVYKVECFHWKLNIVY